MPDRMERKVARVEAIGPGSDKAVVTLADGRRIVLDEVGTGPLAEHFMISDGGLDVRPSTGIYRRFA